MVLKTPKKSIYRWYDPILFVVVLPVISFIIRLLLISYRPVLIKGQERASREISTSGGRAVYTTWHQRLIFHARQLSGMDLTIMISRSRDGEFAARLGSLFRMKSVRGSSTRGGLDALKELIMAIKEGTSGGMVVDGPLGPARRAKTGALIMARDAQVPLIPLTWGADRCWVLNSWDRLLIPKPFSRIVYLYGEPVRIPVSAEGEELERYRKLLEESLNQGTLWCDEQFGVERPWRKDLKRSA